jgi:hypothetical protein
MPGKAGLLTFHWAPHVGAYLQAYALYNILKSFNLYIEIINFLPKLYTIAKPTANLRDLLLKYHYIVSEDRSLLNTMRGIVGETLLRLLYLGSERRKKVIYETYTTLMKLGRRILSLDELRDFVNAYDIIVVGSDQVWNPQYLRYSDYAYLIPFHLKNIRKIAYAASFGIDYLDSIPSHLLNTYKAWLRDFDAISVREQSDVVFLSKLAGKEITHTLDPTLLFNNDWWGMHALPPSGRLLDDNADYVFVYNLTYDMMKLLEPFLDKLRKKELTILAYYMPRPFPLKQGIEDIKHLVKVRNKLGVMFVEYVGPFEFLWLIKNAKYVITNSYHGTIFSILFEKNFIIIPPQGKSKRILDLLNLLGLEKRAISVYCDVGKLLQIIMEEIDYDLVIKRLEFYRSRSLNFLSSALLGGQYA